MSHIKYRPALKCDISSLLKNKNRNPVCNHLLRPSKGRIQARYPPTTPSGTLLRAPFRASVVTGRFTRRFRLLRVTPPSEAATLRDSTFGDGQAIDMLNQRRPQRALHSGPPASQCARMTRKRSLTRRRTERQTNRIGRGVARRQEMVVGARWTCEDVSFSIHLTNFFSTKKINGLGGEAGG